MSDGGGTVDATTASNGASIEVLKQRLVSVGVDTSVVEDLMSKLKSCCIHTMGALRAFHQSIEGLVGTMFEPTGLGKMQAQGLLATVRVRTSDRTHEICSVRALAHAPYMRRPVPPRRMRQSFLFLAFL